MGRLYALRAHMESKFVPGYEFVGDAVLYGDAAIICGSSMLMVSGMVQMKLTTAKSRSQGPRLCPRRHHQACQYCPR